MDLLAITRPLLNLAQNLWSESCRTDNYPTFDIYQIFFVIKWLWVIIDFKMSLSNWIYTRKELTDLSFINMEIIDQSMNFMACVACWIKSINDGLMRGVKLG